MFHMAQGESFEAALRVMPEAIGLRHALLDELPAQVATAFPRESDYKWRPSGDPTPADAARTKVLEVLEELAQ